MEQDRQHLTNLDNFFPHLVWGIVLNNLKETTDVKNCSRASIYFAELLHEKVVLQKVFEILIKLYADKKNKDEAFKENNVSSIPWKRPANKPHAHQMTGILKCRLVSKKWNEAIESFFEGKSAGHYAWYFENSRFDCPLHLMAETYLHSFAPSRLQSVLDRFKESHFDSAMFEKKPKKNPLVGRSLRINYIVLLTSEESQLFHNNSITLAQAYGHEIYYLDFGSVLSFGFLQCSQLYKMLREFVTLTPNLRVLRTHQNAIISQATLEEIALLEQEFARSPFPKLANLKFLSTVNLRSIIFNQVLRHNKHISQLDVTRKGLHYQNYAIFEERLPNLSKLCLEISLMEHFEDFEHCQFTLHLKRFKLNLKNEVPFFSWSRIFDALESKLDSGLCSQLELGLPKPGTNFQIELVLRDSIDCRLNLPNIKKISILNGMPFCLDFLLPSKNCLSEIQLSEWNDSWNGLPALRMQQVIKFLGFRENIQSSNISTELPLLKKLSVGNQANNICFMFGSDGIEIKKNELNKGNLYQPGRTFTSLLRHIKDL